MDDFEKEISRAYKFSRLLKIDIIKKEIEENIYGYSLKNVKYENSEWIF